MGVYIEIQETVWNKYRVYGIDSEEELQKLMEHYGHNCIWSYDENLDIEYQGLVDFIDSDYETIEAYEE